MTTTALDESRAAMDGKPDDVVGIFRRLNFVLLAVREVWLDNACLTRAGAEYLGLPFNKH